MKKFLLKILLLMALVAVVLSPLAVLYERVIMPNRMIYNGTDKYRNMPDVIQVANLGNSHGARSFVYDQLKDVTGFNFALSAQTLTFDWAVLDCYQKHLAQGAVLFVNFSYFTLYYDEEQDAQYQSRSRMYDDFLPTEYHPNPQEHQRWLERFPFLRFKASDLVDYVLKTPEPYLGTWRTRRLDQRTPEDIADAARKSYEGHAEMVGDGFDPRMMEALDNIMNLCAQKGWHVVFYTAPYPEAYVQQYDEAFLLRFAADMRAVSQKYSVPWLDYSTDARFADRYELFMDCDHLNKTGAEQFTQIILSDARALYPDSPLGRESSLG